MICVCVCVCLYLSLSFLPFFFIYIYIYFLVRGGVFRVADRSLPRRRLSECAEKLPSYLLSVYICISYTPSMEPSRGIMVPLCRMIDLFTHQYIIVSFFFRFRSLIYFTPFIFLAYVISLRFVLYFNVESKWHSCSSSFIKKNGVFLFATHGLGETLFSHPSVVYERFTEGEPKGSPCNPHSRYCFAWCYLT